MVLALNTGLIDKQNVVGQEDDPEIEIALALRLRRQKQAEEPASSFPTFGGAMKNVAEAVQGDKETQGGVEKTVRGFAAAPFRILGGLQDIGEAAVKDPVGTGKQVGKAVAKDFYNKFQIITRGPDMGKALGESGQQIMEDPGGWTFEQLMTLAGAAGTGQGIATAVKAARAVKDAGGMMKAVKAFAVSAKKAAPEMPVEQAAKVFTEATGKEVTADMLDALKAKFKPDAPIVKPKKEKFDEAMLNESLPGDKKSTLTEKFEGDEAQAMALGSFGDPVTMKQLGTTISRGIEKMGGGGKPKDAPGIRIDNLNVGEDVKAATKAKLDDVAKQISGNKGEPMTHEEILDRAVEADLLKGIIDRDKTGDLGAALTRTQQNLVAMAEKNPVGLDPEWATQAMRVSSVATDLGRRLNFLKIPVKSELYEFKMSMLKELTGRGHDLAVIVKAFENVDFTDAAQVGRIYKQFLPRMEKVSLWIDKFRYTNMLSGPKTHIINQTGNAIQSLLLRPIDRFNWGLLDWSRNKLTRAAREAYVTDFVPYYRGFVGSAKDGAKMAFDVLRGKSKITKPDLDFTQLPLGGAYTPVEVIPRLMEAADIFTRTMMEGAEVAVGTSATKARSVANSYLFRALPDVTNKTGQGAVAAMFDRATMVAEMIRKDFRMRVNGKEVNIWNPAKLLIPFVQTPMNILKEGAILRNPLLGSANLVGNTAKMESVAKMMTGGMVIAAAGAYAFNNRITYRAPETEKGKQLFYGAGLKPYSVILPDGTTVGVQRLGSVAYPFVLASATKWYFDKNPKAATEENLEKTSQVMTSYAKFLSEQSYMQGIGSVLDALEGEGKLVRAATGPVKQFIPLSSLQKWVNDYFIDPVYRRPSGDFDANGIAEQMYQNMVGMSSKLKPYRDKEEFKEKRQNPTLNAFSPVEIGKINRQKRGEYNEYLGQQRQRAIDKQVQAR